MSITNDLPASAAAAAAHEIRLEAQFRPIGLALDINALMPAGVTYNRFTSKLTKFADANPVPTMLSLADEYIRQFVQAGKLDSPDLIEGAAVYVIGRIWAAKRDEAVVFTPGLLEQLQAAKQARVQQVGLHMAVSRLAKYAAEDSFAAGMKVRVTQVLEAGNAHQLASITRPVEIGVQPLPMAIADGSKGDEK